jgi:hypothetical protein
VSRTRTGSAASPRLVRVEFDPTALGLLAEQPADEYLDVRIGPAAGLSLQVSPDAPTAPTLLVFGEPGGVLRAHCRAVPYAVVAILLACGEITGRRVRCGFPWPPGLLSATAAVLGYGTAGRVRALVRRGEPDPGRRPVIHLGD